MTLKPSFYNIYIDYKNTCFCFNTLHGTLCEISLEVRDLLKTGDTLALSRDVCEILLAQEMLVASEVNEYDIYCKDYALAKINDDLLTVTLFCAMSCNLICQYCFQQAFLKRNDVLSEESARILIRWFTWELEHNAAKGFNIDLYGGEPLLARNVLPVLLNDTRRIALKHSVPYHYSIITNGTLLSEELIDLFIEHAVDMQITVDGKRETHNQRRIRKGGVSRTYDDILCNIKMIVDKGGQSLLRVRMNVDKDNVLEISDVASTMHHIGVKSLTCGQVHFREKNTPYSGRIYTKEEFERDIDFNIFETLHKWGYAVYPADLSNHYACMFSMSRGYAVNPSLQLFKCDDLVGIGQYVVGRIRSNGMPLINDDAVKRYYSREPGQFQHCQKCRLLPICGCGCAMRALNARGDLFSSWCEASEESVKRRVLNYVKAFEMGLID
jgi:uncharacterized protein